MPRIARCTREDPHRVFSIDWVPYLLQLCLGPTCCGVPFGEVRQNSRDLRRLQTMHSVKGSLDWQDYNLPAPYDAYSYSAAQPTCLIVLSLFAAFPELTSIPAFNQGAQDWTGVTHDQSAIGVGNCHDGAGSVYCMSVAGQIMLRQMLLQHTQHVFTTDVNSCVTFGMHRGARAAAVAGDA
jgi:hypothetical protein